MSPDVKVVANGMQVRKKADPAKNLVKGWLSDWKDAPGVQGEASYTQLSGVRCQVPRSVIKATHWKRTCQPSFPELDLVAISNSSLDGLPISQCL